MKLYSFVSAIVLGLCTTILLASAESGPTITGISGNSSGQISLSSRVEFTPRSGSHSMKKVTLPQRKVCLVGFSSKYDKIEYTLNSRREIENDLCKSPQELSVSLYSECYGTEGDSSYMRINNTPIRVFAPFEMIKISLSNGENAGISCL